MIKHKKHGHMTEAQRLDCELTEALNRQAGPVTTVISRVTMAAAHTKKIRSIGKAGSLCDVKRPKHKHGHGHRNHHGMSKQEDCALVDSLNRQCFLVIGITNSIHAIHKISCLYLLHPPTRLSKLDILCHRLHHTVVG